MSPADPSALQLASFADVAALSARRSARWRPGLAAQEGGALHSELFASSREAGGAGAALALALDHAGHLARGDAAAARDGRSLLWVQTRDAARLCGKPYRAGLPEELRERVVHVLASDAKDALFALEEGLRCHDMACVVGEIAGNPRPLDFTASRRLTLASERYAVPLFLIRLDAARDLSSARMRWEVASAPSLPGQWNPQAPGQPVWRAELFRARGHAPGEWLLHQQGGRLRALRERQADNDRGAINWTAGLQRRQHPQQA